MDQALEVLDVLRKAASSWPDLTNYADPKTGEVEANLVDVLHYASELKREANIQFPLTLPDPESGRKIVELVDGKFVSGPAGVRLQPVQIIARRANQLLTEIEKESLLAFDGLAALVASLFMWHGCISMAKSVRRTYVTLSGEKPYSLEQRQQSYEITKIDWQTAENSGNPWIRHGVSVARRFETARANSVVEDWIPKDSPYWK
jgi:hypothetical protein